MAHSPTYNRPNDRRRGLLIVAVAAIGVAVYALMAQLNAHTWGFPLDDSWIHQTYARNFAQTGHWEFVPGVPSAGSTSPFYTMLLAVGYGLHLPFFAWTDFLGAAALAIGGLVGARIADRLFPSIKNVGLWTGLALVTAWHLVWAATSGMETVLFGTLGLIVIFLVCRELDARPVATTANTIGRGALTGVFSAILIATRPEGILMVGLAGMTVLIARPQPDRRTFVWWSIGAIIGGSIAIAPYLLLNLNLNGTVLPNTFSAKQAENAPLLLQPIWVNLLAMIQPLTAGGQLLLVPGALLTTIKIGQGWREKRREIVFLALALWPAAHILLYTLRLPAPYQHGRYVVPALPPVIILGVGGTLSLVSRRRLSMPARVVLRSLIITTLALFVIFWGIGAQTFGHEVRLIDSEMVVAAKWLHDNILPDRAHLL